MGKQMVILANSRKKCGRCIAGKDAFGKWIRLTKYNHNPIPISEAQYYGMFKVLDVENLNNNPSPNYNYHTENSTYSSATVLGDFNRVNLDNYVDNPIDIFGIGKCVNKIIAQTLTNSLLFVKVSELCIYIKNCGIYGYKTRGQFMYRDKFYTDIAVTDSSVEERFKMYNYPYEEVYKEAYITISLGEIFEDGAAYKLISGVILN